MTTATQPCLITLNMTEAKAKFEAYLKSGIEGSRKQGADRFLAFASLAGVNTSGFDLNSKAGIQHAVEYLAARLPE